MSRVHLLVLLPLLCLEAVEVAGSGVAGPGQNKCGISFLKRAMSQFWSLPEDMWDTPSKNYYQITADCPSTGCRLSVDCMSTACRPPVGRVLIGLCSIFIDGQHSEFIFYSQICEDLWRWTRTGTTFRRSCPPPQRMGLHSRCFIFFFCK